MRIIINGFLEIPEGIPSHMALRIANRQLRDEARDYSYINLGRLSKVHQVKILQWQYGMRTLMIDELRRIANVLNVKFECYE